MEIKSYHFETFFQGLLFWLQYDFLHKRLRKKVLLLWKMHGMFTTMEKRDLILKAPLAIFNMQIHKRKKSLKLSFRDFQWHFVLGLQKFGTFLPKILFSGFFQKLFFLWLSYIDSGLTDILLYQTWMKKQWKGFITRRRVKFNEKKI